MTTDTPTGRPRRRIRAVTAATLAMLLAVSGFAVADEMLVSTSATQPGRHLEVLDLRGNQLEELRLRDGVARPFEVRVTDTDQDPGNGFTVDTTMNNLHRVDGGSNYVEDHIASEHVTLGFATNPLAVDGLGVELSPQVLLSSDGPINCNRVATSLGATLGSLLNLLSPDPLCGLIADLLGLTNLLGLTSDDVVAFDAVAVLGELLEDIDLEGLALSALPMVPTTGQPGVFDDANCSTGIGASFPNACSEGPATVRQALSADGAENLTEALENRLNAALDGLDIVSADGVGALLSIEDVLAALNVSDVPLLDGAGNSTGSTVAALGQALGSYGPADQANLINDLLEATLGDLSVDQLLNLSGRYSSYPTLRVDIPSGTGGGEYEGTLTVTLID